jgi:hypothetical protein
MGANIFSSLSGSYNYVNDMSNLLSDYSSIKNGSYGSLLKSYVKKVGNKNALDAYRTTGSTTTATDSITNSADTTSKKTVSKSSFVDNLGKGSSTTKKENSSETNTTVTADKYAKYKSSWLDDQIKQYDKDANTTTAADTSVGLDTTI